MEKQKRQGGSRKAEGGRTAPLPPSAFRLPVLILLLLAAPASAQYSSADYVGQPTRAGYEREAASEAPSPPSQVAPASYAEPQTPAAQPPRTNTLPLPAAQPLTLQLPEKSTRGDAAPTSGLPSIASVIGSLAIVVALMLLMVWCVKRAAPKAAQQLPAGVVEVLGRTALAPRQNVHLIRVGSKLLLVAVSAGGAETLTEITDPLEVDRLAGLCAQAQPNSSSQVFRQVFQQFAGKSSAAESRTPPARRPLGRSYEGSDG